MSEKPDSKAEEFVMKICERTMAGKLTWERQPENGIFQAVVSGYVLRFSYLPDNDKYYLGVLNSDEQVVARYTDEDFDNLGHFSKSLIKSNAKSAYNIMAQAYNRARQQAMGVDKALDDILADLE